MIKQLIISQLYDWIGSDYKRFASQSWLGFADPMCGPDNLEHDEMLGPFREMRFRPADDRVTISVIVDGTEKNVSSVNYADPQFLDKLQAIVEHGKMWASFKKPYPTPKGTELI